MPNTEELKLQLQERVNYSLSELGDCDEEEVVFAAGITERALRSKQINWMMSNSVGTIDFGIHVSKAPGLIKTATPVLMLNPAKVLQEKPEILMLDMARTAMVAG